jgi:hypothetical protein
MISDWIDVDVGFSPSPVRVALLLESGGLGCYL